MELTRLSPFFPSHTCQINQHALESGTESFKVLLKATVTTIVFEMTRFTFRETNFHPSPSTADIMNKNFWK